MGNFLVRHLRAEELKSSPKRTDATNRQIMEFNYDVHLCNQDLIHQYNCSALPCLALAILVVLYHS